MSAKLKKQTKEELPILSPDYVFQSGSYRVERENHRGVNVFKLARLTFNGNFLATIKDNGLPVVSLRNF